MNQANVPIIDLQKARSDASQLKLLDLACKDHGFFLLKNHGIQKEIDDMWEMSKWFFNQARKDKLIRTARKVCAKCILTCLNLHNEWFQIS